MKIKCFEYGPCYIETQMKLTAKDMNKTGSVFVPDKLFQPSVKIVVLLLYNS